MQRVDQMIETGPRDLDGILQCLEVYRTLPWFGNSSLDESRDTYQRQEAEVMMRRQSELTLVGRLGRAVEFSPAPL